MKTTLIGIVLLTLATSAVAESHYYFVLKRSTRQQVARKVLTDPLTIKSDIRRDRAFAKVTVQEFGQGWAELPAPRRQQILRDIRTWEVNQKTEKQINAEKVLVRWLVREGYLPNGSTTITPGTLDTARTQLLADWLAAPGTSGPLDKLVRLEAVVKIIREAGGDPEKSEDNDT